MKKTLNESPQELIKRLRSGVIHIEFLNNNIAIASGSGFMTNGYLVTNNHVFAGPSNTKVRFSWHPEIATESIQSITITNTIFQSYLISGSTEENNDYAILEVPELKDRKLHNFLLESHRANSILDEIFILGFPLEHQNLVCHRGIISSFFSTNNIDIIQLDASVNASNSGGPLINPISGKVIGIVTRKGTGLSKLFDELLGSFDENISFFGEQKGGVILGGVNPVTALRINQQQMKALAQEIIRSANVGIGYAFSVEHIQSEISRLAQ